MENANIQMELKLNEKYYYSEVSTEDVEVDHDAVGYLVFQENYLEWKTEFRATHKIEDEDLGITREIEKFHSCHVYYRKDVLTGTEIHYSSSQEKWFVTAFNNGTGNNMIIGFSNEKDAQRMMGLLTKYIFNI